MLIAYIAKEGNPVPGAMFEHDLCTPIIQVAKDCKTAKGLWFSPGHETMPGEDGKHTARWCWGKFAADFIKEDGVWKILHYHWYDTFMVPYDKSWIDLPQPVIGEMRHPDYLLFKEKNHCIRKIHENIKWGVFLW